MSLTIDTAYAHGRVVGKMVNYGFGMPTRLVADGDVARWCGRLVAHYGGTKALVVLGGDKHTRDELVSAALGSLDRALLERVLFKLSVRRGSFALAPELGSKLHLLWREKGESRATAAKQYAAEALADEEGLSVMGVELAEKNGFLELRVLLRYENETGEAVVTIGGE